MRRIKSIAAALVLVVALVAALPGVAAADEHIWEVDDFGDYWWWPAWVEDDWSPDWLEHDFGDLEQGAEQEAQSGDLEQTVDVSQAGDNANQTVGVQPVGNTGNAQSMIDVIDVGGGFGDYEFEDVGSSIEVSPEQTVSSEEAVNQAATASGWGW